HSPPPLAQARGASRPLTSGGWEGKALPATRLEGATVSDGVKHQIGTPFFERGPHDLPLDPLSDSQGHSSWIKPRTHKAGCFPGDFVPSSLHPLHAFDRSSRSHHTPILTLVSMVPMELDPSQPVCFNKGVKGSKNYTLTPIRRRS